MGKRNKLRYQSHGNQYPTITMTGKVYLRHIDDESIAIIAHGDVAGVTKGDLQIYLSTDISPYRPLGDYEAMGFEGYLKAEVFDGKGWKPLSLEEFFPGREYYFGKRERPIDTYHMCLDTLRATKGTELMRTYREHYVKVEPRVEADDESS